MKNRKPKQKKEQSDPLLSLSHQFAVRASEWAMENLGPEPGWEKAHTPYPEGMGDTWVWLPHNLHQIHGLLQSEDVGRCCFFSPDVRRFLNSCFCDNWFELWNLYDKWFHFHQKQIVTQRHSEMSPEEKKKQGKPLKDYLNKIHSRKLPDGRSAFAVEKASKTWVVTHPDGTVEVVTNLSEFCRLHNLLPSKMCLVAKNTRTHHHGFKVKITNVSDLE